MLRFSETTDKPWGSFTQFTKNEPSTVKIIEVKAGHRLSLQYHNKRDELWCIISGSGVVTLNENTYPANPGYEFWIPCRAKHRIKALQDLRLLEVCFGEFDEADIVRLEDDYNR